MKKYLGGSPVLLAISTIGFGITAIVTGNFHKGLLPVPVLVPGRMALAYVSGVILTLLGLGMLFKKWATAASFYLAIVWLIFLVLLHFVLLSADMYNAGEWTAAFEIVILFCGSVFASTISSHTYRGSDSFRKPTGRLFFISRYSFAVALIVFAILHFKYAEYISMVITPWIPAKLFLAYFVGAAFLLTAISVIVNKLVTLSTGLIGAMFLFWVLVLHGPRAVTAVNSEPEWTSLFVALASSATCFMLSYLSYPDSNLVNDIDD